MEQPQNQQETIKWLDKDNIKLVKGLFNEILDSETWLEISQDPWYLQRGEPSNKLFTKILNNRMIDLVERENL